jgi:hypothetical protein
VAGAPTAPLASSATCDGTQCAVRGVSTSKAEATACSGHHDSGGVAHQTVRIPPPICKLKVSRLLRRARAVHAARRAGAERPRACAGGPICKALHLFYVVPYEKYRGTYEGGTCVVWKKVKPAARCSHTVAVMRACRQQLYLWCTAAMPCDAHAGRAHRNQRVHLRDPLQAPALAMTTMMHAV